MITGLEVEVRPTESWIILTLKGRLDEVTAPTLRSCIDAIEPSAGPIVLDLEHTTEIDSVGIGCLIELQRDLAIQMRSLQMRRPSDELHQTLEVAGVADLLDLR